MKALRRSTVPARLGVITLGVLSVITAGHAAECIGNTFTYAPSKGYIGDDAFSAEMNYRRGEDTGKFFVHFNVVAQQ